MQKRQLEKARKAFATGLNTEQLKARVTRELEPIKDTYDVAYQAVQKLEQLIQSVDMEDKPVRAMRELMAALRDASTVLTAMRNEARDSVRFAAEAVAPTAAPKAEALPAPVATPQLPPKREP